MRVLKTRLGLIRFRGNRDAEGIVAFIEEEAGRFCSHASEEMERAPHRNLERARERDGEMPMMGASGIQR